MQKIALVLSVALSVLAIVIIQKYPLQLSAQAAPRQPVAIAQQEPAKIQEPATPTPVPQKKLAAKPTLLSIPAIGLSNRIVPVGINSKGEMDVPSGNTKDIGWYAKGVIPGNTGSAVMDAHVYAAFSKLEEVKKGDLITVTLSDGTERTFKVTRTKTYALSALEPEELFNRQGGRYLHLITCAGELTPDGSTYTHRLVVYATLI